MPRGVRLVAVPVLLGFGAAVLWGCESLVGFGAVSIFPIYGYADGCTAVKVSGHGFEEGVNVRVGGAPLVDTTWPTAALDQGFLVTGLTPPGTAGLADVKVTVNGEDSVLKDAFYYVPCPLPVYMRSMTPSDEVIGEGTTIEMKGCNLSSSYTIRIGDNAQSWDDTPDNTALADIPIESICSSADVSITIPAGIADGEYLFGFFDSTGAQVWPSPACNIRTEPGSYPLDTADSSDFDPCAGAPTITIGDPS